MRREDLLSEVADWLMTHFRFFCPAIKNAHNRKNSMIRLLAIDLEGTLLSGKPRDLAAAPGNHSIGMWPLVVNELGPAAIEEDRRLASEWDGGRFSSYVEWCHASLNSMREHGLTQELFERALAMFSINEGAETLIAEMNRRHIPTIIISGGFYQQARKVQALLRVTHSYAAADLIWKADGSLDYWNLWPTDYHGKTAFLGLMAEAYHITLRECAFIGDGANDVPIASEVGISFAYQANRRLREVATYSVAHFDEVAKIVGGA